MFLRVIITGGGTGGHVYPALAIARGLQQMQQDVQILYVGTSKGLEADVVPRSGFPLATITVKGFERRQFWKNIPAIIKLGIGFSEAWLHVKSFRPHLVVGTGGYVSGPVCLVAVLQGIPVVLHEQNAFPGLTNRILARFARAVCLTFPEAAKRFPAHTSLVTTGLPVRPEILSADREASRRHFGLQEGQVFLVVAGGSQGARSINQAMLPVMEKMAGRGDVKLLHITGYRDYESYIAQLVKRGIDMGKCGNISIKPYVYDMENVLAAADLVIGRSGASFLAEILVRNLPSILIPYSHATSNHQEYNARSVACKGAAVVILDKELKGNRLVREIEQLINNKAKLQAMAAAAARLSRPDALNAILQVIQTQLS